MGYWHFLSNPLAKEPLLLTKYVPPENWDFLTNTRCWLATPGLVVHTRDCPLPFQCVSWWAIVLTPRIKVGTIYALEPSICWHDKGGTSLFWKTENQTFSSLGFVDGVSQSRNPESIGLKVNLNTMDRIRKIMDGCMSHRRDTEFCFRVAQVGILGKPLS